LRFFSLLLVFALGLGVPSLPALGGTENVELKVAIRNVPPFAIKEEDGSWGGLTVELWEEIARSEGWKSQFVDLGLPEMLGALGAGDVDVAAAALTMTAKREAEFDFSHPFLTSGLGIAVPLGGGGGWAGALTRLISPRFLGVVIGLLGLLLLVGVLTWLFERRRNPQFGGDPVKGIGSGLWWSAVTMTTVGYGDKAPITPLGRALALVWMFAGIIVISSFTAAITTALALSELGGKVRGSEDLSRARVVTVADSTSDLWLAGRQIPRRRVADLDEALRLLDRAQADAVVYDEPVLRYQIARLYPGVLKTLPVRLEEQDYGIAFPSGSPLRETVNRHILRHIQSAEWRTLRASYLGPPRQ